MSIQPYNPPRESDEIALSRAAEIAAEEHLSVVSRLQSARALDRGAARGAEVICGKDIEEAIDVGMALLLKDLQNDNLPLEIRERVLSQINRTQSRRARAAAVAIEGRARNIESERSGGPATIAPTQINDNRVVVTQREPIPVEQRTEQRGKVGKMLDKYTVKKADDNG